MKSLLIILLAGYAVRSDENNYYVIEMQDVPPTHRAPVQTKKLFNVYWNVPTMQCASKKIYFENLYENFGIIQNRQDRFKGENITILYDPGLFPALLKNESSGKIRFRNGGVPQEGNLSEHLDEFQNELDRSIPDKKFSGVAIIDFESWRPQFRQNFGVLQPYKDVSIQIERKLHWWWKEAWIKEEAKRRFEEAARTFMQSTLSVAKKLRPLARWGFYGFPYCFNMASNHLVERCADGVPKENDEISWLWSESTALYPSIYSSVQLSTAQLVSLIRGRMREAARCAGGNSDVILPYFWYRYRDAGYLTETDLSSALSMLYKSAASGFIIWGSSNDVNTIEKCNNLKYYVQNVLGPAIAKYTKPVMRDTEEYEETTTLSTITDAKSPTPNLDLILDPEFHWMPPDNYSQDVINNVEEHINNKNRQNVSHNDNFTVLQNNSVLIDLILNAVLNSVDNVTTTTDNPKTIYDKKSQLQQEIVVSITELNMETSTHTSQITDGIVTKNPLLNTTINSTSTDEKSQAVGVVSSETPTFDETTTSEDNMFEIEETDETTADSETNIFDIDNGTMTTGDTNIDITTYNDYDITIDEDDDNDDFYNSDVIILFFNKSTTVSINEDASSSDTTNTDFTKDQIYTQGSVETKESEISTEKTTDLVTTDKSDITEVQSTEFIETEIITENDTSDEDTYDFFTESNTESIYSTKYVPHVKVLHSTIKLLSPTLTTKDDNDDLKSSSSNNEHYTTIFNEYQFNTSILTTTPISLRFTNLYDMNQLESHTEISHTTDSEAPEIINTSMEPDSSKSTISEDTDMPTSIVPSTDQVIY